MGRIPHLQRDALDDKARAVFDRVARERGVVPNSFKVFAHRSPLLTTLAAHYRELMLDAQLPARLKQMVLLRVAHQNACHY